MYTCDIYVYSNKLFDLSYLTAVFLSVNSIQLR